MSRKRKKSTQRKLVCPRSGCAGVIGHREKLPDGTYVWRLSEAVPRHLTNEEAAKTLPEFDGVSISTVDLRRSEQRDEKDPPKAIQCPTCGVGVIPKEVG